MLKPQNPVLQKVTIFGGKVFEVVMKSKWGSLIQYDWLSQREEGDTQYKMSKHREKWKQREGGYLQAKERGLQRNQTCRHLDFRISASRILRKFLSFKPPNLWYFVMAALANWNSRNSKNKNEWLSSESQMKHHASVNLQISQITESPRSRNP